MAIRSSPRSVSRDPFPRPPAPALYRNIAFSFLGITILVVLGVLWLSSVRARVVISVKSDTTSAQASVEVSQSPEQGQLRGKVVQGNFDKMQEFSVKQREDAQIAQDVEVSGTVKVINNYSRQQTLVKNTRLLTSDGRLYRLDKTIVLDPKDTVTVTAKSDQKGRQYVMAAGTKLSIPGLWIDLQKWIYAESVSGFTGGQLSNVKVVSQLDVNESQKALEDAVYEQAVKTLTAEAGVSPDWKAYFTKKVIEKKTNVTPGQSSDNFLASVKLEVTGVFFPKADMEALVRQKLRERLPDGRDLINFDSNAITYNVEQVDAELQRARFSVSSQALSRLTDKSPALSTDVFAGLSIDEARTKLMSVDGVQDVQIEVYPGWIKKIPSNVKHIEVIVK
ncbi:hypothetical protein IT408_01105 [Candidatus Uhrbacteria bacterium]|nr:hypothetical protein [Candidatus Uhrbacteria bacterium]